MSRAAIETDNPISFGKIAIMFGTVALLTGVMLPSAGAQARSKRMFVLMLVAGATSAGTSLISGSKGSWVSLFIIGTSVAYLATSHLPAWRRQLAAVAVIVSLLIAGLLATFHAVQALVVSGLKAAGIGCRQAK